MGRPPIGERAMTGAERVRKHRARMKAAKATPQALVPVDRKQPIKALADWTESVLKVPPGHPLAGKPMRMPLYIEQFLQEVFEKKAFMAALSVGRKNSKSAGLAMFALGYLAGPLRHEDDGVLVQHSGTPKTGIA